MPQHQRLKKKSDIKTKRNIEDCIKIMDHEWKEDADKVMVRTVDNDVLKIKYYSSMLKMQIFKNWCIFYLLADFLLLFYR